jgi:hypothetical protein
MVAKLISSPADGPRSYICDECVAVCNSILGEGPGGQPEVQRRRILRSLWLGLHRWIDRMFGPQRKSPPIGSERVVNWTA